MICDCTRNLFLFYSLRLHVCLCLSTCQKNSADVVTRGLGLPKMAGKIYAIVRQKQFKCGFRLSQIHYTNSRDYVLMSFVYIFLRSTVVFSFMK